MPLIKLFNGLGGREKNPEKDLYLSIFKVCIEKGSVFDCHLRHTKGAEFFEKDRNEEPEKKYVLFIVASSSVNSWDEAFFCLCLQNKIEMSIKRINFSSLVCRREGKNERGKNARRTAGSRWFGESTTREKSLQIDFSR